jgi:hypothetical protein
MSTIRVVTLAITTAVLALPGQALANWGHSLQSLGRLDDLSPVINAACGPNYVRTHHQGSSNYVCVHRATILPGGPKFTIEPKQPLSPSAQSSGKIKTK